MRTIAVSTPCWRVVRHDDGLGVALRLVVDAARPDRVHMAPVRLRLRVHLRIAVHLTRRREHETRALPLREADRVVGPVRPGLQRVQRHPQVVDRARERGQVIDDVDWLVHGDRLDHVVVQERERVVAEVVDVRERRDDEVVDAHDPVAALEQGLAEVGAEETGAAGDDGGRHRRDASPSARARGRRRGGAGGSPAARRPARQRTGGGDRGS